MTYIWLPANTIYLKIVQIDHFHSTDALEIRTV